MLSQGFPVCKTSQYLFDNLKLIMTNILFKPVKSVTLVSILSPCKENYSSQRSGKLNQNLYKTFFCVQNSA